MTQSKPSSKQDPLVTVNASVPAVVLRVNSTKKVVSISAIESSCDSGSGVLAFSDPSSASWGFQAAPSRFKLKTSGATSFCTVYKFNSSDETSCRHQPAQQLYTVCLSVSGCSLFVSDSDSAVCYVGHATLCCFVLCAICYRSRCSLLLSAVRYLLSDDSLSAGHYSPWLPLQQALSVE